MTDSLQTRILLACTAIFAAAPAVVIGGLLSRTISTLPTAPESIATITYRVALAFFVVAALIAAANFYLSWARPLIDRLLRRVQRHDSGVPVVGSWASIVAVCILWQEPVAWLAFVFLLVLDTGGLFWFVIMAIIGPAFSNRQST